MQLLRFPDVCARTGLSRSSIYVLIRAGDFPRSVPLSKRAVGWDSRLIDQWIIDRIDRSLKRHESGIEQSRAGQWLAAPGG